METLPATRIPQNFLLKVTNSIWFRMAELMISFTWMMLFGTLSYETNESCPQIRLLNWSKISFWILFILFALQLFVFLGSIFGFLNLNQANYQTWKFWDYLLLSALAILILTALIGAVIITIKINLSERCKYLFYLNRVFVIFYGCYISFIIIGIILSQIIGRKHKKEEPLLQSYT